MRMMLSLMKSIKQITEQTIDTEAFTVEVEIKEFVIELKRYYSDTQTQNVL